MYSGKELKKNKYICLRKNGFMLDKLYCTVVLYTIYIDNYLKKIVLILSQFDRVQHPGVEIRSSQLGANGT